MQGVSLLVPEHRPDTPDRYSNLESFLWHDFDAGRSDWEEWLRRKLLTQSSATAASSFEHAMQLRSALRSLQAANSGTRMGDELPSAYETVNRLITTYGIEPQVDGNCRVSLATNKPADPVAGLVLLALDAFECGSWRRFKLCQEPTCRASYYDASNAAVKTWCSMQTCGSRNKMKRYRSKT